MYSVFVVGDTAIYREGIAASLGARHDVQLAGSARTAPPAPPEGCDLYIVDCTDLQPIELSTLCASLGPLRIPVLVVGLPTDDPTVLSYLEAGVSAYVNKEASLQDLYDTVVATIKDGACVDTQNLSGILSRLRSRARGSPSVPATPHGLTDREREVAGLLGRHLSNKEIAAELGISVHTVKHHVRQALHKLGVSKRSEAQLALSRMHKFPESDLTGLTTSP